MEIDPDPPREKEPRQKEMYPTPLGLVQSSRPQNATNRLRRAAAAAMRAGATITVAADSARRVCYYSNWSQYRAGGGAFFPEDIDPSLCTHLIFAFATMVGNQLTPYEWNDDSTPWSKGLYVQPFLLTRLITGGVVN